MSCYLMLSINSIHKRVRTFVIKFEKWKQWMRRGRLLCVGARTGCEVKGAKKAGFEKCIGIDINPLSKEVIAADWHYLPFADESFSNVFTNSLDHCYDFQMLASEISRVLIRKGIFIFETHTEYALNRWKLGGLKEQIECHRFNSMFWDDITDIIKALELVGLIFFYKFVEGKMCHFVFRKKIQC